MVILANALRCFPAVREFESKTRKTNWCALFGRDMAD